MKRLSILSGYRLNCFSQGFNHYYDGCYDGCAHILHPRLSDWKFSLPTHTSACTHTNFFCFLIKINLPSEMPAGSWSFAESWVIAGHTGTHPQCIGKLDFLRCQTAPHLLLMLLDQHQTHLLLHPPTMQTWKWSNTQLNPRTRCDTQAFMIFPSESLESTVIKEKVVHFPLHSLFPSGKEALKQVNRYN